MVASLVIAAVAILAALPFVIMGSALRLLRDRPEDDYEPYD